MISTGEALIQSIHQNILVSQRICNHRIVQRRVNIYLKQVKDQRKGLSSKQLSFHENDQLKELIQNQVQLMHEFLVDF